MRQALREFAKTTSAVRQAMERSTASVAELAERYGINQSSSDLGCKPRTPEERHRPETPETAGQRAWHPTDQGQAASTRPIGGTAGSPSPVIRQTDRSQTGVR